MKSIHFFLLVFLALSLTTLSFGDSKLARATITHDPANPGNIDTFFDGPLPDSAQNKDSWIVIPADANRIVLVQEVHPSDPVATLVFSSADQLLIMRTNNVLVCFAVKQCFDIDQKQENEHKLVFVPAKDKTSADLYLKLGYSPAIGSPAQYSIDTSLSLLFPAGKTTNRGYIGGLATVNTDNRKQVDPDSWRAFMAYQNVLFTPSGSNIKGVVFTWLVGGGEFDRKADNLNFISSPMLEFPLRLFPKILKDAKQPIATLTPLIGAEAGNNFSNAVNDNGQGGIFRGIAGATAQLAFNPKLPGFQGLNFSSSYRIRIPAIAEVFTNTTTNANGQAVDAPFLSRKARNYIKSEVGFELVKSLSFSVTHEYGELPPAFRAIGNKVTIGLTYSLSAPLSATGSLRGK